MANPASWRNRRWKIFERRILTDKDLIKDVDTLRSLTDEQDINTQLFKIVAFNSIPPHCKNAIHEWAKDSSRPRNYYLELVEKPIRVWTPPDWRPLIDKDGEFIDYEEQMSDKEKIEKLDSFRGNTIIEIAPFMTKTEVVEIIDEYWDEIKSINNRQNMFNHLDYSPELSGKVYPTRAKGARSKDILIYSLYKKKVPYEKISWELEKAGFGAMTNGAIRTRISRLNKHFAMLHTSKNKDVTK